MRENRTERLRLVRDQVIELKESPLYNFRVEAKNHPVIGEGSHEARIMLVGEAPGRNEAATGRPFCGSAGRILDELLSAAGITREEIYITNIVKDRPPKNRDPLPEEIAIYAPFLDEQIDIIQPAVIATLGRFSMKYIMEKFGLDSASLPISVNHGKVFEAQAPYGQIKIVPLYHPAAAIYNQALKLVLKHDFKVLERFK
jgi:uracil-DNA glycosylase family 4